MQDAVFAMDVTAAHAAYAQKRAVKHPGHPLEAAEIVVRVPSLEHWNEAVRDPAAFAAAKADHVEPHRS